MGLIVSQITDIPAYTFDFCTIPYKRVIFEKKVSKSPSQAVYSPIPYFYSMKSTKLSSFPQKSPQL